MSDLRLTLRQLLKHPCFTAVGLLTLAPGIGVNTAMCSVVVSKVLSYASLASAQLAVTTSHAFGQIHRLTGFHRSRRTPATGQGLGNRMNRRATRPGVTTAFWPGWILLILLNLTGPGAAADWNQWLGGPQRTLTRTGSPTNDTIPVFKERWRRSIGSGYSGLSVFNTNAVTAMTDGRQDVAVLLDADTGIERWRFPLGRSKKRAEGVPAGPLSTPSIDADSVYVQALDGRFVCLELGTGKLRWEVNVKRAFKAHEPGYGFAGSPLLLEQLVVLLPAGSSSSSVAALDRWTGETRWVTALGSAAEYTSATFWNLGQPKQILAHLGGKLAGVSMLDGHVIWEQDGVSGGLWTPSVLKDGRVFIPTAGESRLVAPNNATRPVWASPVFEGAMGPVVELEGMLIGHHQRRLTALDAATGRQLWQLPDESDGQLLVWGRWLVFVNDRVGHLSVLSVRRSGVEVLSQQPAIKPARMESPLSAANQTLFIRAPSELVAFQTDSAPSTSAPVSP